MPKRKRLAFLTDSFEDEFPCALLRIVGAAIETYGFDLISVQGGILNDPQSRERGFAFDLIHPGAVDAVLICSHSIGSFSTVEELERFAARYAPLPTVSLGVELAGIHSIVVTNEAGMYAATSHLIEKHRHRCLAFVNGPARNTEAQDRLAGFRLALQDHGLELRPDLIVQGDFRRRSGALAVRTLLDERGFRSEQLDAIVVANDEMAVGVIEELHARGIRVPRQMAVVGFDDLAFAHTLRAPLTTVRQPLIKQVHLAVCSLAEAVDGKPLPAETVTLETTLEIRRSCGCARRSAGRVDLEPPVIAEGGVVRTIEEYAGELVDELRRTATGSLCCLANDWPERLISSFMTQVRDLRTEVFFDTVEDIIHDLHLLGWIDSSLHETLHRMRSRTLGWVRRDSKLGRRMDEILREALVISNDVASVALARLQGNIENRMAALSSLTRNLMAGTDLSSLERGFEALTRLGVFSSVVALFPEPGVVGDELELVVVCDDRATSPPPKRIKTRDLVPPGFLEGRAIVLQPLTHNGEQLGIALFEHSSDGVVLELLRQAISSAVKGSQLTREVEQLAVCDSLTGLYNRRHLEARLQEELARCRRYRCPLSLTMIDLDGFKRVNDLHGHDAGDLFLQRVAERLRSSVRECDIVVRFGGDEFVLLQPETNAQAAVAVAKRLSGSLQELDEDGFASASMGIASLEPLSEPCTADELIHRADQALLQAKASGKVRAVHWNELNELNEVRSG